MIRIENSYRLLPHLQAIKLTDIIIKIEAKVRSTYVTCRTSVLVVALPVRASSAYRSHVFPLMYVLCLGFQIASDHAALEYQFQTCDD